MHLGPELGGHSPHQNMCVSSFGGHSNEHRIESDVAARIIVADKIRRDRTRRQVKTQPATGTATQDDDELSNYIEGRREERRNRRRTCGLED